MVLHYRSALPVLLMLVASCGDDPSGPTVMMDFSRDGGFYDAPFPSVDLQDEAGFFDLSRSPILGNVPLLDTLVSLVDDADGAGLSSPVHLRATVPIDENSLPSLEGSLDEASSVFLIDVTPDSPTYLERLPIYVAYVPDTLAYGATQVISLVPLQGAPMRAKTTYAAVVTTRVRGADGASLTTAPEVRALARGKRPGGLDVEDALTYRRALEVLASGGTETSEVAGLAVFTTADPGRQIRAVRDHALAQVPTPKSAPAQIEIFDDYCVFETTIDMPVYQSGVPPFEDAGGRWAFEADGTPVVQRHEEARIFITLPRTAAPAGGFPTAVFVRTGGGGDRPLIDRGPRATNGGATITPGTGPAMHFAEAGFAGVTIDGPHGGPRNVSGRDEQLLVFNVLNPYALRDNIRQSAVELMILPHVLETITIDASACPGITGANTAVTLDLSHLTLMGHSMGATIAPIVAAHEPMYRALVLSGAGGSYIENVLYKQKPLPIGAVFGVLVGNTGAELTRHDVALGFFQWVNDSADPLSFLHRLSREPGPEGPVHVLMMQGITDHYIMPTIANATSLGLGLSLGGPSLDDETPELAPFTPLTALLPLVGSETVTLPASGNRTRATGDVTAIVTQHREDGIEDGHEVVFQTSEAKHQYTCFLYAYRSTGTPRVPAPGVDAMCP